MLTQIFHGIALITFCFALQSFVDTEMKNTAPLKILLENLTIQAKKDAEVAKKENGRSLEE